MALAEMTSVDRLGPEDERKQEATLNESLSRLQEMHVAVNFPFHYLPERNYTCERRRDHYTHCADVFLSFVSSAPSSLGLSLLFNAPQLVPRSFTKASPVLLSAQVKTSRISRSS